MLRKISLEHVISDIDPRKGRGRWLLSLLILAALGCGGSSHELETALVRGTVTLDGNPVTGGYVFIVPGKGRMAKGVIQSDGTFVMGTYESSDGVQVGTHPVIVTPVPADEGSGRQNAVPIPRKYAVASTSGLTCEVRTGEENTLNLVLASK